MLTQAVARRIRLCFGKEGIVMLGDEGRVQVGITERLMRRAAQQKGDIVVEADNFV